MKILVAGAGGAIGKQLVPMLVERGHEVTGTTRGDKLGAIEAMGARAVRMDGLDPDSVAAAVSAGEPEVIVHQLTALAGDLNLRKFDQTFAVTNRLRTEGTDHLLSAARAVGARRFVAQSFTGWPYAKVGGWIKSEEAPLEEDPPAATRSGLAALRHLERAVVGAGDGIEGLALRYGGFYGPGTSLGTEPDGEQTVAVRKRRFPIVGTGAGHWSMIHVTDAATATLAAIEGGAPGIYNVADDDPAPIGELLPYLAEVLGAKPPRHFPVWVGRLLGGEMVVTMMESVRGASNAKAKRELGWQPHFASWRQGFREGLAEAPAIELPAARGSYVVRAMGTTADLEQLRGRAFAIAYRMLGSVGDAEDVAQEALLRLHAADEPVDSPGAYVATVATRLAIDELRSARARRESYVGEWLPEPLPTAGPEQRPAGAEAFPDPEGQAELADSLSLAFLVLLERLTPEQRAALLLHDVFDYSHAEVAAIIGKSPASSRQLASRAQAAAGAGAAPLPELGRAPARARRSILRRDRGRRSRRPRVTARRRRRPARRRRRQGAGAGAAAARADAGGEGAAQLGQGGGATARGSARSGRDQRPARRDHAARRRPRAQRLHHRERRRADHGDQLRRQPGQARPSRRGRRLRSAAARGPRPPVAPAATPDRPSARPGSGASHREQQSARKRAPG